MGRNAREFDDPAIFAKALGEDDIGARRYAALGLGTIHDIDVLETLMTIAVDTDSDIRYEAIQAIGVWADLVWETLLEALTDADPQLRYAAATSLRLATGVPEVRRALELALKDSDSDVRTAARDTLSGGPASFSHPLRVVMAKKPFDGLVDYLCEVE